MNLVGFLAKIRMKNWLFRFLFTVFPIVAIFVREEASTAVGQVNGIVVRRFPLDDYYASLAWLREGRVREAQYGFETTYRASRQTNDEHGIDSVPVLIRIGQMLVLQGDYAEGLKQIEAGLLLSKSCRNWTRYMQAHPMILHGLGNEVRGIQWYKSQRSTEAGVFPDSWPVAIGAGTLLAETSPGELSAVFEVIRLDAIEVYLAQAMGLRLRYRLLGDLAPDLAMSRDIVDAYPPLKADLPEILQRCHSICHALALIANGDKKIATLMLQKNLEVQGGWDHPLTGVGLLALADLAIDEDDKATAYRMLFESTLVFAKFGQHDWLAEAVERLGAVAAIRRQSSAIDAFNEMLSWLQSRSYLSHTAALCAAANLAADLENYPLTEATANRAIRKTSQSVGPLPGFQASAQFALARSMLKQGKIDAGRSALAIPIRLGMGTDLPGPLSRSLFQLQWLEATLDNGLITPAKAMSHYDSLLDGPSKTEWLYAPWECLASVSADIRYSGYRWLERVIRQADKDATILAFDRLRRMECRFYLPIGGRELDLRMLFHAEGLTLNEKALAEGNVLRKQFSSLDQSANLIQNQIAAAKKVASIDSKNWTPDEKMLWSQLALQCDYQERRILEGSTARAIIPNVFPPSLNLVELRHAIAAVPSSGLPPKNYGIIGFFATSQVMYGYLVTADHTELWTIDSLSVAREKQRQLLESIGVGQQASKIVAAIQKPSWQPIAKELQSLLIPPEIIKSLATVDSLTIIPDQWLWYLPFELLPDEASHPTRPWIARMTISYAPTLGIAALSLKESRSDRRTLGVTREGFFVPEKELNQLLTKGVVDCVEGTQQVDVHAKIHWSTWSRLQFDQVWVAANTLVSDLSLFAPMAYDAGGLTSLQQWLQLPFQAPNQMILCGSEVPMALRSTGDGAELFRLASVLAAMGNRSTLINRWSPHGESTQLLLKTFIDKSNRFPASQAWRRSVLSLWETPLQYSTEPILGSLKKDFFKEEFTGSHPIFWSGTMNLGDTHPRQ